MEQTTTRTPIGVLGIVMLFSPTISASIQDKPISNEYLNPYGNIVNVQPINFGENVVLKGITNTDDGSKILHTFISSIVDNMKPLDRKYAEYVRKNYRDLI